MGLCITPHHFYFDESFTHSTLNPTNHIPIVALLHPSKDERIITSLDLPTLTQAFMGNVLYMSLENLSNKYSKSMQASHQSTGYHQTTRQTGIGKQAGIACFILQFRL